MEVTDGLESARTSLRLNCPQCGKPLLPLLHLITRGGPNNMYLYVCDRDGNFVLSAEQFGPLEPDAKSEHPARGR